MEYHVIIILLSIQSKDFNELKKHKYAISANLKKMDKWVPLCCTVIDYVIVMNVLYLNSIINHCIQKMILSGGSLSYLYK